MIRAEWIKLSAVRSTTWTLLALLAATLVLTALIAPGAGLALFCAYAALALGAGIWLVVRRDA